MKYKLAPYINITSNDIEFLIDSPVNQNYVKLSSPDFISEFSKLLDNGGCNTISTPLQKCLHSEKLLLDSEELFQSLSEIQSLMDKKLLITILPTEACNFRCPYCYEGHLPITMSTNLIAQIKKYISDHANNFDTVSIAWFGGEPTLCADTILDVSSYTKELASHSSFKFTSSMTTNGYLLKKDLFLKFYEAGVRSYQITLDGWNHDKTRPLITGKPTLETIINNLKDISLLPRTEYPFEITLRHNILKGDQDFSWYDYLYELFGKDSRFSVLLRSVGDWGGDTVGSLDLLHGSEAEQLVSQHINYIKKLGLNCRNGSSGIFSRVCYASYRHSMVFRANGKIEKCTVALDHPKNLIGHISSLQGVVIDEVANHAWWNHHLQSNCLSCKEVLTCFHMRCRKSFLIDGSTRSNCSETSLNIY